MADVRKNAAMSTLGRTRELDHTWRDWLPLGVAFLVFAALLVRQWMLIMVLNDGYFFYSLDDAYIHLALAKQINLGGYGINPGELAAPSSSILWPLLLAPFMRLARADLVPLVINIIVSIGSITLFYCVLREIFAPLGQASRNLFITLVLVLLIVTANVIGLIITGMEHSLQVFLAMLLLFGLLRERATGRVSWWLLVAIVVGPLVRYENAVLSAPALFYLLTRRHYRAALLGAGLLGAGLVGFSLFLFSQNLGLLPTSVLAKTVALPNSSRLLAVVNSIIQSVQERQGIVLLIGAALCLPRLGTRDGWLAGLIVTAVLMHFVIGKIGWFYRYEVYIWTTLVMGLLYLYRERIAVIASGRQSLRLAMGLTVGALLLGAPYIIALLNTPFASNSIYQQQYQMSRFVNEFYQKPVAINDIGVVTYRSDVYVLDLVGLASRPALERRINSVDSTWIDDLTREHGIDLVMVFPDWFPDLGERWVALGSLNLGRPVTSTAGESVTFYARDAALAAQLRPQLDAFRQTLPPGATFIEAPEK